MFVTKSSPEKLLTYSLLDPPKHTEVQFESKYIPRHSAKMVWKVFAILFSFDVLTHQGKVTCHYNDVIMGGIASQITSLTIVYSAVYSGADQRKHQSSALLAFVREIHRWPVKSPHKWPVTRIMFPFDDVIMCISKVGHHGSDNGSVPNWRKVITCTNAGIALIRPLGIKIKQFSLKKKVWNCHLQIRGHFVSALICWLTFSNFHVQFGGTYWCI